MARILIAVDGSPPSLRALEFSASLAAKLGVGVLLLHTMPRGVLPRHAHHVEGTQLLASLADQVRARGVAVETELGVGDAALAIYGRSEAADIQMVVLGSRGKGAVARLLLGSVAAEVVHTATKPVVVVP